MKIIESGNVFDGTVDIQRNEVAQLKHNVTKLIPFLDVQFDIGSVGFKDASGDMDVFVDEASVIEHFNAKNVKDAKQQLAAYIHSLGYDVAIKGRNVHVKLFDSHNNAVQIDIMVIPDSANVAQWHQHGPRGSYNDKQFKGASIFILMNSIGKALGYKFDAFSGNLKDRATNEIVAQGRDKIAKILLNPQATGNDLNTVSTIYAALANDPKKDEKLAQARADAAKGIISLPESTNNSQWYRATVRDLEMINEAARIEHPEDYLLDGSKKAAQAAVDGMIALATELAKAPKDKNQTIGATSIKWDGKPAVVFGHNKDGTFILTDKSGFSAKSYDGKAESIADIESILMHRSKGDVDVYNQRYAGLVTVYADIWPYLEKIALKQGYLVGDLLYANKADNFVQNSSYVKFRPNQVTYTIKSDKPDYNRIAASKMGIAIHSIVPVDGTLDDTEPFDPDTLPKIPEVYVPSNKIKHTRSADISDITGIISSLNNAKVAVANAHLSNLHAKAPGIADLHTMLRTYANKQVDKGNLNLSVNQFLDYVRQARITKNKLTNLTAFVTENKSEFDSAFAAYATVIDAKHKLLSALNEPSMQDVEATIQGIDNNIIRSHEGLVIALDVGGYKLVDRLGFTRSLRANYSKPAPTLS